MDYEVHGWDLARATGQAVPFEDGEALRALETGRQMLKPEYRGPDKEFGAEVPVPDDAAPMDQLVAFLGRDPGWDAAVDLAGRPRARQPMQAMSATLALPGPVTGCSSGPRCHDDHGAPSRTLPSLVIAFVTSTVSVAD